MMESASSDRSASLNIGQSGSWAWSGNGDINDLIDQQLSLQDDSLTDSVTDRDIAAKAVAFVVNSTRKGIVQLCSGVANLLHDKQRLERRVSLLRTEISLLRAQTTSRTTYSSPASVQSCSDQPTNDPGGCSDDPCGVGMGSRNVSCVGGCSDSGVGGSSSKSLVTAIVHQASTTTDDASLPELIAAPINEIPEVGTKSQTASKEIQCSLEIAENKKLRAALDKVRNENNRLQQQLKELKDNRSSAASFHYEDECDVSSSSEGFAASPKQRHRQQSDSDSSIMVLPGPIQGCRCSSCKQGSGYSTDTSERGTSGLILPNNGEVLRIETGDYIKIRGDYKGHVRYIGHLDRTNPPNAVYLGLELDKAVGSHNGTFHDKRYYTCGKNHGIFVPLNDVIRIISKKVVKQDSMHRMMVSSSGSEISLVTMNSEKRKQNLERKKMLKMQTETTDSATSSV